MKLKTLFAGAILAFSMESALADPVVLDITFDFLPTETAFGMFERGNAPTDAQILADLFLTIFNAPLPSPPFPAPAHPIIPFDVAASSPIGQMNGYAPVFGFFFPAMAFTPYHFNWDLGPGDYTFIIADAAFNGICCGGGYSLSAAGTVVGAGANFGRFERTEFTIPEPGTLALMTLGLFGIGAARRRRQ